MPSIRPVSDLRNHFAEITRDVQSSGEPVFLTKNGVGTLVVMSMECYEEKQYENYGSDGGGASAASESGGYAPCIKLFIFPVRRVIC